MAKESAQKCKHRFHFVRICDVPFFKIKCEGLSPYPKEAYFVCEKCGLLRKVEVQDGI